MADKIEMSMQEVRQKRKDYRKILRKTLWKVTWLPLLCVGMFLALWALKMPWQNLGIAIILLVVIAAFPFVIGRRTPERIDRLIRTYYKLRSLKKPTQNRPSR